MGKTKIPLYKYVTGEVARKVIVSGKLQWSSPIKFNDSFDVAAKLDLAKRVDEFGRELSKEIALLVAAGLCPPQIKIPKLRMALSQIRNLSAGKRREVAKEIMQVGYASAGFGQIFALDVFEKEWEKTIYEMRILSLSEDNTINSMWTRYADDAQGCVLEFRGAEERDSVFLGAKKVAYSDSVPKILSVPELSRMFLGLNAHTWKEMFEEVQYSKTKDWGNEREWRIVTFEKNPIPEGRSYYEYSSQDLTGIYFGYKCREDLRDDLIGIARKVYPHVKLYTSTLDFSKRRINLSCMN